MGLTAIVLAQLGDDPLDSRGGLRAFAFYVGGPAFALTVWLFERWIFGRRRRDPLIRRRPSARRADRIWRERADVSMRHAGDDQASAEATPDT